METHEDPAFADDFPWKLWMFIDFPHLISLQQGSLMTHADFRFKHHQVGQINVWFGRSFWPKVVGGFRYLLNINTNIYIIYTYVYILSKAV